jgi:hypothetical protein
MESSEFELPGGEKDKEIPDVKIFRVSKEDAAALLAATGTKTHADPEAVLIRDEEDELVWSWDDDDPYSARSFATDWAAYPELVPDTCFLN